MPFTAGTPRAVDLLLGRRLIALRWRNLWPADIVAVSLSLHSLLVPCSFFLVRCRSYPMSSSPLRFSIFAFSLLPIGSALVNPTVAAGNHSQNAGIADIDTAYMNTESSITVHYLDWDGLPPSC